MTDCTLSVINAHASHVKGLADRMILDGDTKYCEQIYRNISTAVDDMERRAAKRIRRLERENTLLRAGRR